MFCVFFSSYVLKNERKESKTPNIFYLMLEAKVAMMVEFRAFDNNQCPTDWFKMQIETIGLK